MKDQIRWSAVALVVCALTSFGLPGASRAQSDTETDAPERASAPAGGTIVDTLIVRAASRQRERVVDAPAAVTVLPEREIERESASGQLPKLLEFTPGVDLTQGGLYDFNLNVRGHNDVFNRRLLVLIDGRDAALPSLGSQEWAALPFALDDLASVELVRGPGAALYGADAMSGVLDLVTKAPRDSTGGRARVTTGELGTRKLDLRYAAGLGGDWYLKVLGGATRSRDFARARTSSVEYSIPCTSLGETGCLPLEAVPPVLDRDRIAYGSLRLDKTIGDHRTLVVEGGTSVFDGPVGVTEFGRLQLLDVERPWARFNLGGLRWNVLGYYTGRDGKDQIFLNSAYPFFTSSDRLNLEVQGRASFAGGRGSWVAGASVAQESLDSADPAGRQTVTWRARDDDFQAIFGQVEYDLTDRLRTVAALRWDDATFHEARLSPRASLVYALRPSQTLRLSVGEAYLTPSYTQLFLYLPVAPPLDLSGFEAICAAGGTVCGFDRPVALRAVGNDSIEPEEVRTVELGYSAGLGDRTFLTIDVFANRSKDFVSDFLPYAGPLGRLHGGYPIYRPPAELAPPLAALLAGALEANLPPELFAALSTGVFGEPFFPLLSVVSFGRVDSRGLEVGLTRTFADGWTVDFGTTFFDFEVKDDVPGDPALPNTPEHKAHAGVRWVGERFDAAVRYRWVEGFDWSTGIYRGRVPTYDLVDLTANFRIDERWSLGVDVSNLFDNSHWEFFGADRIERRAVGHLTLTF